MKKSYVILALMLLAALTACRNGNKNTDQSSVLKVDSVYYARGFTIKYYKDCRRKLPSRFRRMQGVTP